VSRPDAPMPPGIARLARDRHGRPAPWFVHADEQGVPDFRVIRRGGVEDAHRFGWCWVCGRPRGRHAAFVIGPMCAVNRVSPEPPSHLDCAMYSARVCPFLTTPNMVRRESGLPGDRRDPAGVMIRRNPGVSLVWSSRTWTRVPAPGGHLYDVGEPTAVRWLARGRDATRHEVLESIDSGLPILRAEAEREGPRAVRQLERMHGEALRLIPEHDGAVT
jgi:hypothetical protein